MKFDITALGEILIDFAPMGKDVSGDIMFARKAGGAPLNLLATASKYGCKTAFIGKVGNDMFGTFLKKVLSENSINADGLVTDELHNTTLAFVALDENGDRDFSFYRNFGADAFICANEVSTETVKNSKIFHFGSLSLTNKISKEATDLAIKTAKEAGTVISYDPNYRAPLWSDCDTATAVMRDYVKYADIIKVSKEEAEMLTGESSREIAAQVLHTHGVNVVLVTDGANGVVYSAQGRVGYEPSLKVTPVDTTGAGDIFFGTFLSEYIKSEMAPELPTFDKITEFVKIAVEKSGLSTLKKGAIASIPE